MTKAWACRLAAAAIVATAVVHADAAPKKTEPALPAPSLALTVAPGTAGSPWKMRIENTGEVPIRIVADPRLLELEITPPAATPADPKKKPEAPKPVRCVLPDDARPSTDEVRELVIPGKRTWSATIDPIYLCFGARERAALVSGANVTARFGWPSRANAKTAPPFVASPVGAAIGVFGPAKQLESAAFALTDAVPSVPGGLPAPDTAGTKSAIALSMPDTLDAARGVELQTSITATNQGERPVTLLFRPEVVGFKVTGPGGSIACGTPRVIDSPIRELFSTLPARGRASLAVLITAVCPPDTFDDPGVYRVFPLIDTTGASGRTVGLRTWDSAAGGTTPMLLRIRTQRRAQPPTRPTLDEKT